VKHYFQKLEDNELTNKYVLRETVAMSGTTDSTLILSDLQLSEDKRV
jgi:hypothetical protein